MRTVLLTLLLLAGAARADALTIRDIIELTKAGLSDEVLLALIDVDGGVYATDPATLKALKEAGVSERVMVALVRSGRERRPEPPPPQPTQVDEPVAPQPQVIVIEHREPEVQQVLVPVPVYVPVAATVRPARRGYERPARPIEEFVPFQSAPPLSRPDALEPAKPVYWGFGGKLRPDAWGQPREQGKPGDGKPGDGDGKGGRR